MEEALRRHVRVVAVVERRLQRQELAADQVVRLARAVQPPPGDRTGIAAADCKEFCAYEETLSSCCGLSPQQVGDYLWLVDSCTILISI